MISEFSTVAEHFAFKIKEHLTKTGEPPAYLIVAAPLLRQLDLESRGPLAYPAVMKGPYTFQGVTIVPVTDVTADFVRVVS